MKDEKVLLDHINKSIRDNIVTLPGDISIQSKVELLLLDLFNATKITNPEEVPVAPNPNTFIKGKYGILNPKLTFSSNWTEYTNNLYYNSSAKGTVIIGSTASFEFIGTSLKITGSTGVNWGTANIVVKDINDTIVAERTITCNGSEAFQQNLYHKFDFTRNKIYTVTITSNTDKNFIIDSLEIE